MEYLEYNAATLRHSPYWARLDAVAQIDFDILTQVYPFKANNFVLDNLIHWEDCEHDPIYKMVFPRREMLAEVHYEMLRQLIAAKLDPEGMARIAANLRKVYAPEMRYTSYGMPKRNGTWTKGLYHNFASQLSLFPEPMLQSCHSYCNYCFRWPTVEQPKSIQQESYRKPETPLPYLQQHPEILEVLFSGAEPLLMPASQIARYMQPLMTVDHLQVISISTKALAWWPYRFTIDRDADELLRAFERVVSGGKLLNLYAHFAHPRELAHPEVARAVTRLRSTGVLIHTQGPIIAGVNDRAEDWRDLWTAQVSHGMVPCHMFIEADHHPQSCFRVPLSRTLEIFQSAIQQCHGLARSVRGPVFMNDIHRVQLVGVTELHSEKYFVLKCLKSPPGILGDGSIALVPYNPETKSPGDLVQLFGMAPK